MTNWNRFTHEKLVKSEEQLLSLSGLSFTRHRIPYGQDDYVSAIEAGTGSPIVLLHGLGGGAAIYFRIMKLLADRFRVISVDMPGMGMSSRPEFEAEDVQTAEAFFVEPLKRLFDSLGLTRVTLWGHSLGGYIAGAFADAYPEQVEKLILVSAVGVASRPLDLQVDERYSYSCLERGFINLVTYLWEENIINPSKILSCSGPMSKSLLSSYMDQVLKRIDKVTRKCIIKYIEMINLLPPSGELALHLFFKPGAWANWPLSQRLKDFASPILFVSGIKDWVTCDGGLETAQLSPYIVQVTIVEKSGHHLYIENPEELTNIVADFIENFTEA
jgi:pimeloyl-ACP methyl ester carboxylesterase